MRTELLSLTALKPQDTGLKPNPSLSTSAASSSSAAPTLTLANSGRMNNYMFMEI